MKRLKKLPQLLYPANFNVQPEYSNDYRNEPRPIGSMAYVQVGCARYCTPDGDFTLEPGDLLFIPPGGTYISHWGESGGRMTVVHFSPDGQFPVRYPVQKLSGMQEAEDVIAAIHRLFESDGGDFEAAERFYHLCGMVWHRLAWMPKPAIDPRVLPAVEYIENNLTEPVTVRELAVLCRLSTSYFYAVFHASLGTSPIEYRKRLLVLRAQRYLLEMPDRRIGEISELLGFASTIYFSRVFRELTGCTPRDFRRREQEI